MAVPRSEQVDLSVTPYYHCMSRCVRRAYLCGKDIESGRNYEHRKGWIESRMHYLSRIFSIKICAYAVMSNHYHLILYVDLASEKLWNDEEVLRRWGMLYPLDARRASLLKETNIVAYEERLVEIRERLVNISWFMRAMNEWIAKESNIEDGCEGRFWEKRFKSQALLDEAALLSAMVYVDLNPIRAGEADTLEGSEYTSIRARLLSVAGGLKQPEALMLLKEEKSAEETLPCYLKDYLALVDETGRAIRLDKKGYISEKVMPILEKLQCDCHYWLKLVNAIEKEFTYMVGREASIVQFSQKKGQRPPRGIGFSRQANKVA